MADMFEQIGNLGIVPVVAINDADHAVDLAKALVEGGLPVAEITFRTAAAEESIRRIAAEVPELLLGAGTVLTTEQADKAIAAGAAFIVSPGFNPKTVAHCQDKGIPITPGICTPTDIEAALGMGLRVLKFFPAGSYGGIDTLKAMSAPYGMLKFIPTGGVNAANLNSYLSFNKVLACGGSWMVKSDVIAAGNFARIVELTREAVSTMLGFDMAHIGINAADADASLGIAKALSSIFNMALKEGNSSNFAGPGIEVVKGGTLGTNGHIAIQTNSIPRAIAYLERNGVEVDMGSAKGPAGGPMVAVFLKDEIGGFAIHLLQKK